MKILERYIDDKVETIIRYIELNQNLSDYIGDVCTKDELYIPVVIFHSLYSAWIKIYNVRQLNYMIVEPDIVKIHLYKEQLEKMVEAENSIHSLRYEKLRLQQHCDLTWENDVCFPRELVHFHDRISIRRIDVNRIYLLSEILKRRYSTANIL